MFMQRAPIQIETPAPVEEEDTRPRTRCGYLVHEAFNSYQQHLSESGSIASGKALHLAADLICSGGLDIWIRAAYSYAMKHINLANPRIFVYLRAKIEELDKRFASLPQEQFYNHPDVQSSIGETVLVLQLCPKRASTPWPKVDDNTKRPGWLKGVASATETAATRRVWSSDTDSLPLYLISNELCRSIQEGSLEKALFWVRWTLEEDGRIRKETKGHGLTSKERGHVIQSPKQRSEVGHYIAALLMEIYKDLATRNAVRMHEEFAELYRLWRCSEKRMAGAQRRDALALMLLICCEVPKWEVPATPTLVKDPVRLSRAVAQVPAFFREVLSYKASTTVSNKMTKAPRKVKEKPLTEKDKAKQVTDAHFDAYDAAMEAYLNKF